MRSDASIADFRRPPAGVGTTALSFNQSILTQETQIHLQSSQAWRILQAGENILDLPHPSVAQKKQNPSLPFGQIMAYPQRRMVAAREKPHHNRPGLFLELRFRLSRRHTPFDDLLRSPAPLFNQSSAIEDLRNKQTARARNVVPLQVAKTVTPLPCSNQYPLRDVAVFPLGM